MRYRFYTRLFWAGLLLWCTTSSFAAAPTLPIQHWTSSNGAEIYFVRRPEIPMLDIQLAFSAGSAYDGQHWGIAHLVNSMLDEGTEKMDANQIAASFNALGAQFGNSVSRDMATVSLRTVTDDQTLQPALDLFETLLGQVSFPTPAFQRIKNQVKMGIRASQQNPMSIAFKAFYKSLYDGEPYGHPLIGTKETLESLTQAQASAFYNRYYVAKNADVIIVGDVTLDKAKKIAHSITEKLATGKKAEVLAAAPNSTKQKETIDFQAKQKSIVLGQVAVTRDNPDYFPLMVGNKILGEGMTSILFNEVRNDRGLVYGVSSQFELLRYRGPFTIVLQTRSEKANEALEATRDVLTTFIKSGPTSDQLKAAQRNITGGFPLTISKNSQIAGFVTYMAFYHLPLNYLDTCRDKVNAVTTKQVQQAFEKWVKPQDMTTIIVGPKA